MKAFAEAPAPLSVILRAARNGHPPKDLIRRPGIAHP